MYNIVSKKICIISACSEIYGRMYIYSLNNTIHFPSSSVTNTLEFQFHEKKVPGAGGEVYNTIFKNSAYDVNFMLF